MASARMEPDVKFTEDMTKGEEVGVEEKQTQDCSDWVN